MDEPLPIERSHTFIIGLLVTLAVIAMFFLWLGSRGGFHSSFSASEREIRSIEAERTTERRPLTAEEIAEVDRVRVERVTTGGYSIDGVEQAEVSSIEDERLMTQSEF